MIPRSRSSAPKTSPVTGNACPPHYLHSSSAHFRDTSGRSILLRGINLSSSAKTPIGQPGAKHEGFWETGQSGEMSFVGRVLDLENGVADQHLERLKSWGFNCLRYVVTWESIEHDGPGKYDDEYIDYTVRLLRKCKDFGFWVYIDPHQDLFSRFSGGSGAPYWTLIACGMQPENFSVTMAACLENEWPTPTHPNPQDFPDMIWASNYSRLACQTLFTLWAAGRDYAPKCVINGVNIQDFLQEHYFNAMRQLGEAIARAGDLNDICVIGWDSLNEPNAGLLGIEDLDLHGKESILRVGPMPTAFQGMRLGMGQSVEIENWKFGPLGPRRDGSVTIDPQGQRAWLDSDAELEGSKYGWTRGPDWELGTCIWALHGIWDPETDELLQPDYFNWFRGSQENGEGRTQEAGRKVDYGADYWLAHWKNWAPVVRAFHPEAIHFIQSPVFQIPPDMTGPEIGNRVAHSSHFYDGLTLVTKHWNWFNADAIGILRGKYASVVLGVKVGETAIRKCLREQLGVLRQDTLQKLGQFPTMMGEIGIPFDLDSKKAYSDGNYFAQVRALDASLNACDGENNLNYTIWTYCPDNSHQWGDLWNGEDLSVWSADDAEAMAAHRSAPGSLVDLVGKIPKTRRRAESKASLSSLSSTAGSSRLGSPNVSSSRLSALGGKSPRMDYNKIALKSSTASNSSTINGNESSVSSSSSVVVPQAVFGDYLRPPPPSRQLSTDSVKPAAWNWADPFHPINLNDGARAISAFCRPYPMRTVGTPMEMNFDIKSSNFKLIIELTANEVDEEDENGELVATEIYVPLVHYAAFPSRVSHLAADEGGEGQQDEGDPIAVLGSVPRPGKDEEGLATPVEAFGDDSRALSLEVDVSIGRWEVEGQILRWFYPRPASGKMTVSIEVRRRNGAIAAWVHQWQSARGVSEDGLSRWSKGIGAYGSLRMPHVLSSSVIGIALLYSAIFLVSSNNR